MQLFSSPRYQMKWGRVIQSIRNTGCSTAGYAHPETSLKTARMAERKNSLHIKLYLPLLDNFFGKQHPVIKLKEGFKQVSLSLLYNSINSLPKVTQKGWTKPTSFKPYITIYHLMNYSSCTDATAAAQRGWLSPFENFPLCFLPLVEYHSGSKTHLGMY